MRVSKKLHIENRNILKLLNLFYDNNSEAYIVGGCVRDLILKENPHDYDICTNITPDAVIKLLKSEGIKYTTVGIEYGTIVAIIDNEEFEITTYRKETGYSDNRHPDKIAYANSIEEDLKRRDFTINALAYNVKEQYIVDCFGGIKDIQDKLIRCVGNPKDRFNEDSLRILRALRFSIRYGFDIEGNTSNQMIEQRKLINNISKERITSELKKILSNNKSISSKFIKYSDIISEIIPEIAASINFDQRNRYHKHTVYEHMLAVTDGIDTNDWILKLAGLLHDIGKPEAAKLGEDGYFHYIGHPDIGYEIASDIANKRLVLTSNETTELLKLIKYHDASIELTEKSVKRALNKYGIDFLKKWLLLKQSDINDHLYMEEHANYSENMLSIINEIINKKEPFSLKDIAVNGNDIMKELGLKPSKQVGITLNKLLDKVINDEIPNDKQCLIDYARETYTDTN